MRKLFCLLFCLLFCFISEGLSQDPDCTENAGGSLAVYALTPESATVSRPFDDDIRIIDVSTPINPEIYQICSPKLVPLSPFQPQEYDGTMLSPADKTADQICEMMCYYHIEKTVESLSAIYPSNPLVDKTIDFKPRWSTTQNSLIPKIQANRDMVEYSTSQVGHYNDLAQDAYAIANGVCQHMHSLLVPEGEDILRSDGIAFGIGSYFAHRGLASSSSTNEIFTYGGRGADAKKWKPQSTSLANINFVYASEDVSSYYSDANFDGLTRQVQSEILFASLWEIAKSVGTSKVDQLLISLLPALYGGNAEGIDKQHKLAGKLYATALRDRSLGFTDYDLCVIMDVFLSAYGNKFFDFVESKYTPQLFYGDLFIQDQTLDDGSVPSAGPILSSPNVWNRHTQDGEVDHQHVSCRDSSSPDTNYLYVTLNGDICALYSGISEASNMNLELYYHVGHTLGEWAPGTSENPQSHAWNDLLADNSVEGDFIARVDFSAMSAYDEAGNEIEGVEWSLNATSITISVPWRPPAIFSTEIKGGLTSYGISLLARYAADDLTPGVAYDHMDVIEVEDLALNVRGNNNIALRKAVISDVINVRTGGSAFGGQPYVPGIIIKGDAASTTDPTMILTVEPTAHDGAPPELVPGGPVPMMRQIYNDYADYGNIVLVLDPEYYQSWIDNGQQGSGYTIIGSNEMLITGDGRGFYLGGLPQPAPGDHSTIAVKFVPYDDKFGGRTAYDLVTTGSVSGKEIGRTHVEVRNVTTGSQGRSINEISAKSSHVIYPNPVSGGQLRISSSSEGTAYEIYSLSGVPQSRGMIYDSEGSIDISTMDAGVYLIRLTDQEGAVETKKIIRL